MGSLAHTRAKKWVTTLTKERCGAQTEAKVRAITVVVQYRELGTQQQRQGERHRTPDFVVSFCRCRHQSFTNPLSSLPGQTKEASDSDRTKEELCCLEISFEILQ